jgi:uncharacterized membrane protein
MSSQKSYLQDSMENWGKRLSGLILIIGGIFMSIFLIKPNGKKIDDKKDERINLSKKINEKQGKEQQELIRKDKQLADEIKEIWYSFWIIIVMVMFIIGLFLILGIFDGLRIPF